MKAYQAWDTKRDYNYSTVVFAETATTAKVVAMSTDACEDAAYIDIRVRRLPEMDVYFRGPREINWYDLRDRKALVALGWACLDTSFECDTCPCKPDCRHWEEEAET